MAPEHGTRGGYVHLECRQECCATAEREYKRDYRSRIRGVTASVRAESSVVAQSTEKRSVAERYSDWEASLRRAAAESCDW